MTKAMSKPRLRDPRRLSPLPQQPADDPESQAEASKPASQRPETLAHISKPLAKRAPKQQLSEEIVVEEADDTENVASTSNMQQADHGRVVNADKIERRKNPSKAKRSSYSDRSLFAEEEQDERNAMVESAVSERFELTAEQKQRLFDLDLEDKRLAEYEKRIEQEEREIAALQKQRFDLDVEERRLAQNEKKLELEKREIAARQKKLELKQASQRFKEEEG